MKAKKAISLVGALAAIGLFAAGCGGSGSSSTSVETGSGPSEGRVAEKQGAAGGAVPSEAQSAATGDIPDNQTFLLFWDPRAGYLIRYPEGWARRGSADDVTFREKANVIQIAVHRGPPPSEAGAVSGVRALHKTDSTVQSLAPERLTVGGRPVVKIGYSRLSTPDPVTGKRLRLVIDRYEYGHGGKVAVVDLATPVGVDNVDAYRMISESFQWLS